MSAVYFQQTKEKKDKNKPARYFNWKLAAVLFISLFVLGVGAFALRQWHKNNQTQQGLIRGTKAYEEGRWQEAAEYLGRYLAVRRDDISVLHKYADAQLKIRPTKRNHVQQAIEAYRTILRVDKNNSEAITKLLDIYLRIGPGEAELIARRQLETSSDPELRRMLALALMAQRKFTEAADTLSAVLQEHPDQVSAYEALGQLVEQRPQDFDEEPAYWFNKAVENNPTSALAYIIRAAFHRRHDEVPGALADLERAESGDLSDASVRLRLAEEFIQCGDLEKAETHLIAVQEAMPKDQGLWRIWAQYARRTQSEETMLKIAEDGLKVLSSQPWDFMPIAVDLYIQCGRFDDANDCIAKLDQKNISPVSVAFLRGSVAAQQGRLREAVRYWRQSLDAGNTSPQVRLALASALSRLGDVQSAMRHLRLLISERPDVAEAHLGLAELFARFGNWIKVAEHANRASELRPDDPEAVLLYLQAQIKLLLRNPASQGMEYDPRVEAIEAQLAVLKQGLGSPGDVMLLEFELALRQGHFAEAEVLANQLKQTEVPREKMILVDVEVLTAQNKMDQAIQRLDEAIEELPESIEMIRYNTILSDQEGHREKCEELLKRSLTRIEKPYAQRELGLLLARLYAQWDQPDKAYTLLLTLSQKLTDDVPIKRQLLLCEQMMNDPQRAQQLVDEIRSLEGEDGWQWRYEQARLWFAGEDFDDHHPEIVSLLQENMLANPNDQASRILLGRCYERAGDQQLALSMYREALRMAPDDLRVIIPTLAALFKAKEYDEAEKIMTRASQKRLSHPELRKWEFLDHIRRGELDSASGILQDLVRSDPNNQAASLSLALLRIQQNELDEASELLSRLKSQDPESLPVTAAQIQISIRRDNLSEALRLADEMVQKLDDSSAYILRARTCATLGRIERAVQDLERAAEMDPNNVQVWMAKSDFHRTMGQMEKAAADIRHALSLEPDNIDIQKRAVSLLFAFGEPDKMREAEILLDRALASNADDVELKLLKVRGLLAEQTEATINEAEQILEKITQDRPEVSEAWVLKGEIAIRRGQSGKAIDAALSGLTYQSNDRGLLLLKARAEAMRSPVLATPTLRGLYEMDPNDSRVAVFLANTYIEAGEPVKAVDLMAEQLTRCDDASRRQCQVTLAVALYKDGDKNRALKQLDTLLEAEPNDPGPLLTRARLLGDDRLWSEIQQEAVNWYEKHPQESRVLVAIANDVLAKDDGQAKETAEGILQTVLQKDPDCVEAMDALALLLLQAPGRADESARLYQRVLELRPNHVIAMNNLAWLLSEEQGKPQEALEWARKGLNINPEYADLLDTRGVTYYRLGEHEKAIQDFARCMRLYPTTAPAAVGTRFHLARAYARLEQHNDAIQQLKQALELQSRIGGLSPADLDEARHLLKQLQEGR
jgi:tetratricopeptide (TPR) repeat protein